jgi:hypothetical protein
MLLAYLCAWYLQVAGRPAICLPHTLPPSWEQGQAQGTLPGCQEPDWLLCQAIKGIPKVTHGTRAGWTFSHSQAHPLLASHWQEGWHGCTEATTASREVSACCLCVAGLRILSAGSDCFITAMANSEKGVRTMERTRAAGRIKGSPGPLRPSTGPGAVTPKVMHLTPVLKPGSSAALLCLPSMALDTGWPQSLVTIISVTST